MAWKLVNPNITNDPSYLDPRLSDDESKISSNTTSLAQKANQTDMLTINVLNPPSPLVGAKGDGTTDDTTAIQNILNSLKGKTGIVFLPSNKVFPVSQTLIVPDSIEIRGSLSTRYGSVGSTIPTTVIKWIGATNGTMLSYRQDTATIVYGAKIRNISLDGNNITGVTGIDMTNSKFGLVEYCSISKVNNGIYLKDTYYNTITRCIFDYFKGIAINLDFVSLYPNDNTITENYFSFRNANTIGIKINGGNSTKIILNRFEGYATGIQPICIQGSNAKDTAIAFNRMEVLWDLRSNQTPIYLITISNTSGRPMFTKITGNQLYPEEIDSAGVTHYNYNYAILDQGFSTICDDYIDDNYIPNGALKQYNGAIPIWKSNNSAYTASYDSTEDAVKLVTAGSTVQYPYFYNIIDAKKIRNKILTISALFKCSNITTTPKIEVTPYKGGNGTVGSLGTYDAPEFYGALTAYKSNDYMLLVSNIVVPSDADNIFININPNGNGSTTPADNSIWVKFVALSEKRAFKANPNKDLIMSQIDMNLPTAYRPAGSPGLHIFDTTLNKPIWCKSVNPDVWVDATGTTV